MNDMKRHDIDENDNKYGDRENTDRDRNNTHGAREYAEDQSHTAREIDAHWWKLFSNYRLKRWQSELRRLMEQTGVTPEDICAYAGLTYSERTVFLTRLPRKRITYIGIGMALGQPVETIDRWICKYGMKQSLYAKDICEDLIWIYLINANYQVCSRRGPAERDSGDFFHCDGPAGEERINYYGLFDQCTEAVYQTYCSLWEDYIAHDEGTAQVLHEINQISFDESFHGLTEFVADHMDAFKTAYAKPRQMLATYADLILRYMDGGSGTEPGAAGGTGKNRNCPEKAGECKDRSMRPLSDLRGYLDDSMINYLSGDPETIHARKRRGDRHTISFKSIPKGRKKHIALALALGMTQSEVDNYLQLMGFTPLDAVHQEEGLLIHTLRQWEQEHPLQRRLKEHALTVGSTGELRDSSGAASCEQGSPAFAAETTTGGKLSPEEAAEAVQDMLHLRQDLNEQYRSLNQKFPYMRD